MKTIHKQALAHIISIIYIGLMLMGIFQILTVLAGTVNHQFMPDTVCRMFQSFTVIVLAQTIKFAARRILAASCRQPEDYPQERQLHVFPSPFGSDTGKPIRFDPWIDEWYGEGPWWKKW